MCGNPLDSSYTRRNSEPLPFTEALAVEGLSRALTRSDTGSRRQEKKREDSERG